MKGFLSFLLCLLSATGAAAPPVATAPARPRTSAAVSVGYVLVPFCVTDLKGRPVRNLKERDVVVLVDGQPVVTDLFTKSEDGPVSFTILLDGSGSMGLAGKMEGAKAAIDGLLSERVPGDDFALYVFAGGDVRETVPFTSDPGRVRRAVQGVKPFGKTAFFDALARMPDRSLLGRNGSRAIILLTDGIDNASKLTRDELASLLQGVDVPVYPVGLRALGSLPPEAPGQSPEALLNLEVLGDIARITGGRLAILDDPSRLPQAVRQIEQDLRSQYLVGFSPTGQGPVKYRRISLKLPGSGRPIRVRAGYRGTSPPYKGG